MGQRPGWPHVQARDENSIVQGTSDLLSWGNKGPLRTQPLEFPQKSVASLAGKRPPPGMPLGWQSRQAQLAKTKSWHLFEALGPLTCPKTVWHPWGPYADAQVDCGHLGGRGWLPYSRQSRPLLLLQEAGPDHPRPQTMAPGGHPASVISRESEQKRDRGPKAGHRQSYQGTMGEDGALRSFPVALAGALPKLESKEAASGALSRGR